MTRLYFDTNIFSYLKQPIEGDFSKLEEAIKLYRGNLSFVFSPAHIRDKRKDKTDKKMEDFHFMESFVMDNYLSYHGIEGKTTFYLATPKTVFDDEADGQDLSAIAEYLPMIKGNDSLLSVTSENTNNSWISNEIEEKIKKK